MARKPSWSVAGPSHPVSGAEGAAHIRGMTGIATAPTSPKDILVAYRADAVPLTPELLEKALIDPLASTVIHDA